MKAHGSAWLAGAAALCVAASPAGADDERTRAFVALNTAYMNHCAESAAKAAKTTTFDADGFEYCTLAIDTEPLSRRSLAVTYNNRGILMLIRGDKARAKTDFDAAIKVDPSFGGAYVSRAWVNVSTERFNDALADANAAIGKGAATAQAYYNRAAAYEGLGNAQRAYRDYIKAAELDPAWDWPKTELARFTVKPR